MVYSHIIDFQDCLRINHLITSITILLIARIINSIKIMKCSAAVLTSIQQKIYKVVDSGPLGDNSCVYLPLTAIKMQNLHEGNLLRLTHQKNRKQTLAILFVQQTSAEPQIVRMNHVCRKNLAVEVGDFVYVQKFEQAVQLEKVVVKKIGGCAPCATPQYHQQNELIKYFQGGQRPICCDDMFEIKTNMGTMEFKISCTEPSVYGFVTENTMIAIDWQNDQLGKANLKVSNF